MATATSSESTEAATSNAPAQPPFKPSRAPFPCRIFEVPLRELGPAVGSPPPRLAGYVVRLRGLPFTASLTDVLQFFAGLDIVRSPPGVVFTCTPDGRPSGEAYVEFMTAAAQQSALQRHKQQLGTRYIELFPSSKGDLFHSIQHNGYYTGMGASVPTAETGQRQADVPLSPGSHVTTDTLRLRGLPYSAGLADIEAFFSGNAPCIGTAI